MKNNGTRNVGTKLSGSTVIGSIETPFGSSSRDNVPDPTATSRSVIPNTCHATNAFRDRVSASCHATSEAVAPMKMSP